MQKQNKIEDGTLIRFEGKGPTYLVTDILYGVDDSKSFKKAVKLIVAGQLEHDEADPRYNSIVIPTSALGSRNSSLSYPDRYAIQDDVLYRSEKTLDRNGFYQLVGRISTSDKKKIFEFLEGESRSNLVLGAENLPEPKAKSKAKKQPKLAKRVQDLFLVDAKDLGLISDKAFEALNKSALTVREALKLIQQNPQSVSAPQYKFDTQYPDVSMDDYNSQYEVESRADPVALYAKTLRWAKSAGDHTGLSFADRDELKKLFTKTKGQDEYKTLGDALELRIVDPGYISLEDGFARPEIANSINDCLKTAYDTVAETSATEILEHELETAIAKIEESDREDILTHAFDRVDPSQKGGKRIQASVQGDYVRVKMLFAEKYPELASP